MVTRMSKCYRSLQRAEWQMKEKIHDTYLESQKILAKILLENMPFSVTQYGSVTAASITAFKKMSRFVIRNTMGVGRCYCMGERAKSHSHSAGVWLTVVI